MLLLICFGTFVHTLGDHFFGESKKMISVLGRDWALGLFVMGTTQEGVGGWGAWQGWRGWGFGVPPAMSVFWTPAGDSQTSGLPPPGE